jgi:phosphonatase-like hydrolase
MWPISVVAGENVAVFGGGFFGPSCRSGERNCMKPLSRRGESVIELAVFDMAGTTVEDGDAVRNCLRATLAAVGAPLDRDAVTPVMGLPKPEALRRLLLSAGKSAEPADVAPLHADFIRRIVEYYRTDPAARALPGAADSFRRLRAAGVKVALNTGFSSDIVEVLLRRLGWSIPEVVDGCVCSDQVPHGRPHPDMVQALMRRFGVADPRRVAKIGDTVADLAEGEAAGCGLNIGVATGACSVEELRRHPHTHLVPSVVEATDVILSRRPLD